MKYLLTGGAGFIGKHLSKGLLADGHEVLILDDFSNAKKELVDSRVKILEGSLLDVKNFAQELQNCDGVFHLAAEVSVPKSLVNPKKTLDVNGLGVLRLLEFMRDMKIPKIVYSCTCAVYGDKGDVEISEDMLPAPLSPYAYAKLEGEYLMKTYAHLYGIKAVIFRYFNVYGVGQDPNSPYSAVIPIFISKIQNGEKIRIFGDGKQTRDFVRVEDVVEANKRAMNSDVQCEVINVGCGKSITLLELINILEKVAGKKVELEFLPHREGDIVYSKGSIKKLKELLKFEPSQDLEAGLKAII
jgi:UDP-glucose 4-epimerase